MKRQTVILGLLLLALTVATGVVASPEAVETAEQAGLVPAVTAGGAAIEAAGTAATPLFLSGCTRAECFQEYQLCQASCATLPNPNDIQVCEEWCTEQFFECIDICQ
jgi:hypothetical protein